jgi:hypothetical protein
VKNKPKIEVRAAVLEDMAGVYEMDATLYGNILEEQTQDSPINMFGLLSLMAKSKASCLPNP